jgi:LytS/YehU family sensor histidine kinase
LNIYYTAGWVVVVLGLLVLGNRFISRQFSKHLPWLKFGRKRLFAHLFLGISYSLIIINVAYLMFKWILTDEPPTSGQMIVTNAYGLVMFIPAFSVYFSLHFLRQWQVSELETEKFKKETLKSQFDNLKNHLDPHFLFNNLNILSALIDKDKNESKMFLDKFADVYRSLLKSKEEDLIALQDELDFINAYIYLLKTRFEENVIFNINVGKGNLYKMIPPLTLQLLIENAIKHNIISEKKPLIVDVTSDGNSVKVCNSLNERKDKLVEASGSGLDNIRSRYAYFSERDIEVVKSEDEFCVTIPLIEVETI